MNTPLISARFGRMTMKGMLCLSFSPLAHGVEPPLRAGAHIEDVTGSFDSYLVSGGFTERRRGKMNPGDLKARCFVLQRGKVSIAIAIVDSCMIPRTVCDEAKKLASKQTGIPTDRILIAATHTHSAPSVMNYCLGTMADPAYTKFLPLKIAEGIRQAHAKLEPARIGWSQVRAPDSPIAAAGLPDRTVCNSIPSATGPSGP